MIEFLTAYRDRVVCTLDTSRHIQGKNPASIDVIDGIIHFVAFEPLMERIRDHEVGHVIAATDEELLLPNIGLSTGRDYSERDWVAVQRQETGAFIAQAVLDPHKAARLFRIGASMFRLDQEKLWQELSEWSLDRLHEAFQQQLEKIRRVA